MVNRIAEIYLKAETLVAGILYAVAASILFVDVLMRELLGQSIWGGQRMSILLANSAAFIGIGVAASARRHIRPVVLDKLVPGHLVPSVERIGNLFAATVLFMGAYYALLLVMDNRDMGFTAIPLSLKIWIPQCVLVYSLISAGLRYLLFALNPSLNAPPK